MLTTAKIFKNGDSQAVRLPKALHLEGDEVWISKNEATGEIKLTPKKKRAANLDALFNLLEEAEVPEEFMAERCDSIFLTKDEKRLRWVNDDGILGGDVDLDDLTGIREWLRGSRPMQSAESGPVLASGEPKGNKA